MKTFKITIQFPDVREPFVDWYNAETEQAALVRHAADMREFCLGFPSKLTVQEMPFDPNCED